MARARFLLSVGALVVLCAARLAHASVMVVAAHPDDDVILAAGVVHAAALRGERVTVVYMTNGDFVGGQVTGLLRQAEAVAAQGILGVGEDALVFLGYPDGRLSDLFTNAAYAPPGAVLVTTHGQSTTFGARGLGRTDYHAHRFGMHASYNKRNVIADLVDLIGSHRPDHVVTHAEFDTHPDHQITNAAVREAMRAVAASEPTYVATLHRGLVWSINFNAWPAAPNPTTYLTEPPGLAATTVKWLERQSLDVPRTMQSPTLQLNPKHRAVGAHASQGGTGAFIGKFVHRDEVFWAEDPTARNVPPRVDAGASLSVAPGATVVLDGSLSADPEGPLEHQWTQRDGPAVKLTGATTARPTFVAPSGLVADEVLTFGLVVDDGVTRSLEDRVAVTVLARGVGATLGSTTNIAPRATASASSETRESAQDASKAVDEMVAGWPTDPAKEWVTQGERAGAWLQLEWGVQHTIDRVVLHDRPNPDDHATSVTLTFDDGVAQTVGPLDNTGRGLSVQFPPVTATRLRVTIDATSPSTANAGLAEIAVYGVSSGPPLPPRPVDGANLAAHATVSASSFARASQQDASKAIDGVADGWPSDHSKEWVTAGERAGAWIQLEWSSARTVSRVVLYDRPNETDQVTGATLSFSDGSTVAVPSLDNRGAKHSVAFKPRLVTSLRVTLTSTSPTTLNVGLSEIEVYEQP